MAGPHGWVGASGAGGTAFNTGSNWDTGLVPADTEAWFADSNSAYPLDADMNQSAKTFSRVSIADSCPVPIGTAASPLLCDITDLVMNGTGSGFYQTGTVTRASVGSAGISSVLAVFDTIFSELLSVMGGTVTLDGSKAQASGALISVGSQSGVSGKLIIDSTVDLTTNDPRVSCTPGGVIECSADVDDLRVDGGRVELLSSAACALVSATAGTLAWLSDGTLTTGHFYGNALLDGGTVDHARTLGTLNLHDRASLDLRHNRNLTISTGIRPHGDNTLRMPSGRLVTI